MGVSPETPDGQTLHTEINGQRGYSFGEHLANGGYIVVAVDHLGVGEGTDRVDSLGQNIAIACEFAGARPEDSNSIAPRSNLADMFYGGEVPQEVIDADTAATRAHGRTFAAMGERIAKLSARPPDAEPIALACQ